MSNGSPLSHKLLEKLAEKRAKEAALKQEQQFDLNQWAEFVPDIELDQKVLPPQELEIDEFFRNIPITEAYKKWCGKSAINNHNREVKAACPNPDHPDKEPSCSFNTDKQVFMCFKCGFGGDIYTLAALNKGYPVPGYQDKQYFRQLKESMAGDFGFVLTSDLGGEYLTKVDVTLQQSEPNKTEEPEPEEQQTFFRDEGRIFDSIDWRSIIPVNTFMRAYLDTACMDDCPEEFHFWNSLVAVACAAGRMRILKEAKPVFPNLFICLTGPSGSFKSKAKYWLNEIIDDALPYNRNDDVARGVKVINGIQSGEALVHEFLHPIIDPATNKPMIQSNGEPVTLPITGLIDFEEFAAIAARTQRSGSTLETYLMDLYDNKKKLETKGLKNPATAYMPSASIICTTQNKSLRTVVSAKDANSGFLNKFTFVTGVQKKPFAINLQELDFTRASGLLRLLKADCKDQKVINWEPDAYDYYTKYFDTIIDPDKRRNIDNDIFQRIDVLLKKIALLFAINERASTVTASNVSRVLSLYNHIKETNGIIEESVAATEVGDSVELIRRTVKDMTVVESTPSGERIERGPTPREVYLRVKRKVSNLSDLKRTLQDMADTGILFHQMLPPGPKGGPRTNRYTVIN